MTRTVLTVGEILVEIMATTRGDGFREPQPLIGPFPSGAPAIFIDQVGRLGTPAAIVSRVGDDDFGRLNRDRLRPDGVDVSGIEVAPGEATGSAFVRHRPDGSRAFVHTIAHSATGRLTLTPSAEALIDGCDHLHIMGTALSAPGLATVAREAIARIKSRASHFSRSGRIDATSLRVEEVDPTGAGDCFAGAFVSFWLAGASPETALPYANAAGAHAVTQVGPMEGAATRSQLDALRSGPSS